jgi:SAM-dependent methyltransferase
MSMAQTRSPADPFGDAYELAQRHQGNPGVTYLVYELENGYVYAEDAALYFSGPEAWWPVDRLAFDRCVGRVLDIGCGPGRQGVHLMDRGHEVVGVDPSPKAVAAARRRGLVAYRAGLPDLCPGIGSFDTFLLSGANLSLFTDPDITRGSVASMGALARPGARMLGTNAIFPPGWKRMRVRHRATASDWADLSFHSPEKLIALAGEEGWRHSHVEEDDSTAFPTYLVELEWVGR